MMRIFFFSVQEFLRKVSSFSGPPVFPLFSSRVSLAFKAFSPFSEIAIDPIIPLIALQMISLHTRYDSNLFGREDCQSSFF